MPTNIGTCWQLQVIWPMHKVSALGTPSIDCLQVVVQSCLTTAFKLSPNTVGQDLHVYLPTRMITATQCVSKVARLWPRNSSAKLLNYILQVCTIMSSKYIFKLIKSWLLRSHDYGLKEYSQIHSITASMFPSLWPPSSYVQTCAITASKGTSKLAPLHPPSLHCVAVQVRFDTPSIMASDNFSELTHLYFSGTPRNVPKNCL